MYSAEYLKELQEVHSDKRRQKGFGGKVKSLGSFKRFISQWQPKTVLDYGCGKGVQLAHLKELYPGSRFHGYDPAVKMFSNKPDCVFDCVFCIDVLEHIEPEYIDSVILDIDNYTTKYAWIRIDTMPARKKLSSGKNAHLIIKNEDWWLDKITQLIGNFVYKELTEKGKLDIAIEKSNG